MYLDFSKIELQENGMPEYPILRLQTLAEKDIGIIPFVYNLRFTLNYSDLSEIEFDVPRVVDGVETPLYEQIMGYKLVRTEALGIYVLMRPTVTGDGISETKHVLGYSIEQLREKKTLFLEEGVYKFCDIVNEQDYDELDEGGKTKYTSTIMGRVLELFSGWRLGYVSPSLYGVYRSFDEYDEDVLKFCYNTASETFQCTFVFDVYKKAINVYDVNENLGSLPIYLSYENLVKEVEVNELSDEIITKLHVYGADDLSIAGANPLGTDYIVDLAYFVENGDLDVIPEGSSVTLAEKYLAWQQEVLSTQAYYMTLISARASATTELIMYQGQLTELNHELDNYRNQQSQAVQALALSTTEEGKRICQEQLEEAYRKITAKEKEISNQEDLISQTETSISQYASDISAVAQSLSIEGYFSPNERKALEEYLHESSIVEDTFVATDVTGATSGDTESFEGQVTISDSTIVRVDVSDPVGKSYFDIVGGNIVVTEFESEVIRGTLVKNVDDTIVLSLYVRDVKFGDYTYPSGMLTITGASSNMTSDIVPVTEEGIEELRGTTISFTVTKVADRMDYPNGFFTSNVSEYQKYSVMRELYLYGAEVLGDMAVPTYEFSVESSNFLFLQEFEPFKNKLKFGRAIHLNMADGVIDANFIGVTLDYDDISSMSLTFSNRYKKRNGVKTLEKMIKDGFTYATSFNAKKFSYAQTVEYQSSVSEFMRNEINAATNKIVSASGQTVTIDGAGIHVGGDSNYQIRIVDSMIAMTDDNWQHAKLAIGLFESEDIDGPVWGVNTDVLAGKLLIGENVIIESIGSNGVVKQFRFDSSGASINNGTLTMQKDDGGKILLDPRYGILAGTGDLFTVDPNDPTSIIPSFVNQEGDIEFDSDGFPLESNFYLSLDDGNAYFRGKVVAGSGAIGGWTLDENKLYGGAGTTYVALNSSGSNDESAFAFWAGAEDAATAPFWVKRNGQFHAENGYFTGEINASSGTFSGDITGATGTFSGVVQASDFLDASGSSMMSEGKFASTYLNLKGLNVNNNFIVDENGKVTINNGSISWGAVTGTEDLYNDIGAVEDKADAAQTTANSASTAASNAATAAQNAADAVDAEEAARIAAINAERTARSNEILSLAQGTYTAGGTTFIYKDHIYSPYIVGGQLVATDETNNIVVESDGIYFRSGTSNLFSITTSGSGASTMTTITPQGSLAFSTENSIDFSSNNVDFSNANVDFTGATVTGINTTARFG